MEKFTPFSNSEQCLNMLWSRSTEWEAFLMQFNIEKVANPNQQRYTPEAMELARKFTQHMIKEFGTFVKAAVLFGSAARFEEKGKEGDIDILVIVDDVSIV